MKKSFIKLLSVAMMAAFFACSGSDNLSTGTNDSGNEAVEVQFQPDLSNQSASSQNQSVISSILRNTQVTNASSIVVTLSTTSNTAIAGMTQKKINLINFSGNFISEPLLLSPGTYRIQEFSVLDADNNALYAAPKAGSARAYLVTKPLYIDFTVSADNITMVTPVEVITTADATPADFGYASFDFLIVNTFKFCINTMIYNETTKDLNFTTADINVTSGAKTLYSGTLAAIANNAIEVPESASDYVITLKKALYDTKVITMTMDQLKAAFNTPVTTILSLSQNVIARIKISGGSASGGGADNYTVNVTNTNNENVRQVGSVGLYFYVSHTSDIYASMSGRIASGEYFVFAWGGGSDYIQRTFTFYNQNGNVINEITLSASDLADIARSMGFPASDTFVRFYYDGTVVTTESITL